MPPALKAPLWIIEQATVNIVGVAVASIWIVALAMLIWRARIGWRRAWPTLTLPLPWIALAIWAGLHWRSPYGPQTGFHAEAFGMVALALTIGLSVFAIVKAKGAQMPVFGLALLNGWFCFVAALISAMATTGSWL
jgi:hypothetical protein